MRTIALALVATSWTIAAPVSVGLGSYSNQIPSGLVYPSNSSGAALAPAITANVQGAIPTNDWSSSLVFQRNAQMPHSHAMFPHPWMVQTTAAGLRLGSPAGVGVSNSAYVYGTSWDLTVAIPGQVNSQSLLDGYSDWTIRASLFQGSLKATYGHGLPFIYLERQGALELQLVGVPNVISNLGAQIVFQIGDRNYMASAPSGSQWTIQGQVISTNLGQAGYCSIAMLPDGNEATRQFFAKHAYSFITDTKVEWAYDSTQGISEATYKWTTQQKEGDAQDALMALYPHQWRNATNPSNTAFKFRSPRGLMEVRSAKEFTTRMPVPGLFPIVPFYAPTDSRYDANRMTQLLNDWSSKSDEQLVRSHADTYWTGKDLGRLAILVQLADAAGQATLRDRFLTLLRNRLEGWLTYTPGENNEFFAHQSQWGSLIGMGASYGSGDELNDHHFHYGYYLMAAATVAKYVTGWSQKNQWGGMVDLVAREAANPDRGSSFSPFLRNFDPYAGHSWAAGHANFGDGNNQESSSEALNFSAGLLQWGLASGDTTWRNLGVYLYATEIQAVREYWFDVHNDIFPQEWNKLVAGMVWGGKVDHATWFSGEPEMIHGINYLPLTGASLYLGMDKEYAAANYQELIDENGGEPQQWPDIIWGYRAFSNADDAYNMWDAHGNYAPEDGETQAHMYAHILSLAALGDLDAQVRGNIPTSAVFVKQGIKTYCVYNPTSSIRVVQFTDGSQVQAPALGWVITKDPTPVYLQSTKKKVSFHRPKGYDLLGRNK